MMVSGILDSKSVVSLFLGFLKISKSVNILKIYCPNINEYCHKITKICEVLSPKRRCERTLPRDPLENFSNLYFIGERKLGFKKTKVNRPFSNRRKPLLSRWVGGWMGGRWFLDPSIFLRIVYTSKMCWFQKWPLNIVRQLGQKLWAI